MPAFYKLNIDGWYGMMIRDYRGQKAEVKQEVMQNGNALWN